MKPSLSQEEAELIGKAFWNFMHEAVMNMVEHVFRKLSQPFKTLHDSLAEINDELCRQHLELLKYKTKKRSVRGRCLSRIKRHYHPNKGLSDELISQI